MHDLIHHGSHLDKYDHFEFPGVVPRTFIGPLLITIFSSPFLFIRRIVVEDNKLLDQYICRSCLGIFVAYFCTRLLLSVRKECGVGVSLCLSVLSIIQFHFNFYATRTLPNTFALIGVLIVVREWILTQSLPENNNNKNYNTTKTISNNKNNTKNNIHNTTNNTTTNSTTNTTTNNNKTTPTSVKILIWTSSFTVVVFRAELVPLLGMLILHCVISGKVSFGRACLHGCISSLLAIVTTMSIDSLMWQQITWPELHVLWFNTVLNKSSQWGTSPFLWYFYSALPRSMGAIFPFFILGMGVNKRILPLTLCATIFVFLFSFLPHKELRFIIYTIPIFNLSASLFVHRVWLTRNNSLIRKVLFLLVIFGVMATAMMSAMLLYISSHNYPGGETLNRLHTLKSEGGDLNVHLDVFTAQTGVTRFMEKPKLWKYNKTEELGVEELQKFSHLLIGSDSGFEGTDLLINNPDLSPFSRTHTVLSVINSFQKISLTNKPPFIRLIMAPKIVILEKNKINR